LEGFAGRGNLSMKGKKESSNMGNDLYSVLGSTGLLVANSAFNFMPGGNILFIILASITGSFLVDDILSSKWERMFKRLDLFNSEKELPYHIKAEETEKEIKHIFKVPVGINVIDFYKAQDLIESALCKKVKIETEGSKIVIKEYKTFNIERKWEEIFKNCGLRNKDGKYPALEEVIETKIGNRFIFKLPPGFCLELFQKYKPLFETALHKPLKIELTKDYRLIVQIYDVQFKNIYKPIYDVANLKKSVFPLGISLGIDGEQEILIDLDDDPHILVGGINGAGKTSLIKALLTVACLKGIEIRIIDFKMMGDYNCFKYYKNLKAFINYGEDIIPKARNEIKNIRRILKERSEELNKNDCPNFREYNKKFPDNKMEPIIVLIEEYITIADDKKSTKDLIILLSQARAANIKFILSLQRPSGDNLDPTIKANCNHVIACMVNNTYNSGIILGLGDDRAFTDLHGKGEAIFKNANQDEVFKSYFLTDSQIKN
jgi:S-DNA-T family DNA segregation ATPase FtsK/SpoIIIE